MAGAEMGPATWPFPVEGGATSPVIVNGQPLDQHGPPFTIARRTAGNVSGTLAGTALVQQAMIDPLAPIGARPDTFSFSVGGRTSLDWETLDAASRTALNRFGVRWPVTDAWGLAGEVAQRQTFYMSRYAPAADLQVFEWYPYVAAEFRASAGVVTPLTVIATGSPADDEILLADTFVDFDDVASYSASTGDLTALGPGELVLRYDATRFGQLALDRTVPTFNALAQVVTFTEALPRRTWADSLL